jgi:putative Mg2+ transporter-C (MgtC) family protein
VTPVVQELSHSVPHADQVLRVALRMFAALIVGTIIGLQRELTHKPAGLRTHLLVALGTALLVVAAVNANMKSADVSRVIQGLITGIGFLGGGTILKLTREHEIRGLTTAAGIWLTAAASIAAGLGEFADAFIGVFFALIVLTAVGKFGGHPADRSESDSTDRHSL